MSFLSSHSLLADLSSYFTEKTDTTRRPAISSHYTYSSQYSFTTVPIIRNKLLAKTNLASPGLYRFHSFWLTNITPAILPSPVLPKFSLSTRPFPPAYKYDLISNNNKNSSQILFPFQLPPCLPYLGKHLSFLNPLSPILCLPFSFNLCQIFTPTSPKNCLSSPKSSITKQHYTVDHALLKNTLFTWLLG